MLKELCLSELEKLRISKDLKILESLGFVEGKDINKFIDCFKDIIKYAPENCSFIISTYIKLKEEN